MARETENSGGSVTNDLLETAMEAHGGLTRWNKLSSVSARLIQGGALWALKGQPGVLDDVVVTASLHEQRASHRPFGAADRHSVFTPQRVAIERDDGTVIDPRSATRLVRRAHARDPVERAAARLFRRHGDVDLPDTALHVRAVRISDT
jgi:hypothetical protein